MMKLGLNSNMALELKTGKVECQCPSFSSDKLFPLIFNGNNVRYSYSRLESDARGVGMECVRVILSSEYDRKAATVDFERNINTVWQDRMQQNPNLFNGTKFRLAKISHEPDGVTLYLGSTCYRDFVCTNMSVDHAEFLRDYGEEYYNDDHACFSDALGVDAIVLSSDNQVVFVKRSDKVYEAAGQYGVPGGHPEPDMITKNCKSLEEVGSKCVVHELFYSVVREVRDEINIPEEHLDFPTLLGIGRNQRTNGRPEMVFLIKCSLSSQEIRELYNKGGPEAYESTQLVFIHADELQRQVMGCNNNPTYEMKELLENSTPGTKASIELYFNTQFHQ